MLSLRVKAVSRTQKACSPAQPFTEYRTTSHVLNKMRAYIFVFIVGSYLLLSSRTAMAITGRHVLERSIPDAFQVFAKFPHLVAISDSNNDTIMECLTLERTHINQKSRTATYVFVFKGHHGNEKKNVPFHISSGDTADKFIYYAEDDPTEIGVGIIIFTNYKNCYVVDGPYHMGEHCVLLVSKGVEDNVPTECTKEFGAICGVAVDTYTKDLCSND